MEWPIYKKSLLILGNSDSNIAICTLWSQRERIAKEIDHNSFSVVGNLYSGERGMDFLIRNLLSNPKIGYLVVCGSDRSGSGQALVDFFNNGFTKGKDEQGDCWLAKSTKKGRVDIEIPSDVLEDLRKGVKIFDLRGQNDTAEINTFISGKEFQQKLPSWGKVRIFPKKEPKTDAFPAESSGYIIRAQTIAGCWVQILRTIMLFGVVSPTHYESKQKELLNLTTIVSDEDPDNPFIPQWMPFDKKHLENYYPKILTAQRTPEVSYNYGHRMRAYFGCDQVQEVIDKLKKSPDSRSAVIVLWDAQKDLSLRSSPCLNHIRVHLRAGKLYLTAVIRSNDMFGGWPENAFGLRKLQQFMSKEIGNCSLGDLTIMSESAHLYDDCWKSAQKIVEERWQEVVEVPPKQRDPRGNFVISIEKEEIVIEHCSPKGDSLQVFKGRNPHGLMFKILPFVSSTEHAAYLGFELQKAWLALKSGILYVQDRPLS